MATLSIWLRAARPKTLFASLAPVIVTSIALASQASVSYWLVAVIAVDAMLLQIAANFANDVIDFKKGADTAARKGPMRVTQAGLVTASQMWIATKIVLFLALLLGIILVQEGGLPILIIGLFSMFFAVAYTGGPFPLAYLGLGEVATLIFFGVLSSYGTSHLLVHEINLEVLIIGAASSFLAAALLVVNNYRDMAEDQAAKKRTLAVRFGKRFTLLEYKLFVSLGFLLPAAMALLGAAPITLLFSLIGLIPAISLCRQIAVAETAEDFQTILTGTGKLLLLYIFLVGGGYLLTLGYTVY